MLLAKISPCRMVCFRRITQSISIVVLIPVRDPVNVFSLSQVAMREIIYYHVELDRHAVLFAGGLPCGSYLDTGDRESFSNGRTPVALHSSFGSERSDISLLMDAVSFAPLRVIGDEVSCVKSRLEMLLYNLGPYIERTQIYASEPATLQSDR
jgi:hypothetical protein